MKLKFLAIVFCVLPSIIFSQANRVQIASNTAGSKLVVNGEDFMINGMNWDYFPIGTNFNYSLWNQSDELIQAALDREMSMLQNMGVNTIRVYTGIPARWITYIYQNYGIYTVLNHSFGRYGLTLDGAWVANTEYADPRVKELLLKEVTEMVQTYKNTPGLLMFLLGNENNYGLFWEGAETEDIPVEDRKSTERARAMYKLFNEATVAMKRVDSSLPIAICNGDLLFLEIIVQECPDVDVLGVNMYRGLSFGDAFDRVKREYGKPLMFTEFGSDAFNVMTNSEDQESQAQFLVENWREIYENAAGIGKAGNSIGGFTFQFSDGWWKYGQTSNLDVHDNNASWSNGGYSFDYREGVNNMNEEWFGICAKGLTDEGGLYALYPRASYYALKDVHMFNPYASNMEALRVHFGKIKLADAVLRARGDKAALEAESGSLLSVSRLAAKFTTFNTGGSLISTPDFADPDKMEYPNQLGFDHMQSFFVEFEANPAPNVRANVAFNVLGHVAENPIDQIFYENRGRPVEVNTDQGDVSLRDVNRVQTYQASVNWNHNYFNLDGFYRTGHYHWGYEGDFFGLYPEANYGPNIDIYNGEAPLGMELEGKKSFNGLKLAFGPELWWGANPAILLKYQKQLGKLGVTGIFHEDLEQRAGAVSSFAIPQPKTRRATLAIERDFGKFGIQLGGIYAGAPLVGRTFQVARGDEGNYSIYETTVQDDDTYGGKIKLTYTGGSFNWYAQAAAMGLVANGGGDYTQTFTGWRLKDSGSGNQYNVLSGFTFNVGDFQIAPNFLYQIPIEGPIPSGVPAPGRPRNILDDPFVVRSNRETVAGEILFTYDPTPATWMYSWDNDVAEDANFAFSAGFVYRHHPTTQDAAIGILPDGRTTFAFPGAPPAADLWEAHARFVSKVNPKTGIIGNLYTGTAQANGDSDRTINRFGADLRIVRNKLKINTGLKVNDWGPYDYYRDFNLTFPLQLIFDISTHVGTPSWFDLPTTKFGVMGTWRTLDQYSPRYCPTTTVSLAGVTSCAPEAPGYDDGSEWEIRTYIHIDLGK